MKLNHVLFPRLLCVLVVGLIGMRAAHAAAVLHFFPGSAYNASTATMDATLGTTGRTTDDFETTDSFISGLSIVLSGGVPTTTETSLPALFDGDAFFPGVTSSQFWDGTHTASNAIGNVPNSATAPNNIANLTTFMYAPGTLSFGIGLSNFQSENANHELFVNGVDLGALETLAGSTWAFGFTRNAYLRIDSDVPITSVAFAYLLAPPGQQDFLMFDHLTVAAVPEPTTVVLLGVGLVGVMTQVARRARERR